MIARAEKLFPFYYNAISPRNNHYRDKYGYEYPYYVRYCYDEEAGWWLEDASYKGPCSYEWASGPGIDGETFVKYDDLVTQTKTAI